MTDNLLTALNDFKFELHKRTSFINEDDVGSESKPFLEAHKYVSINEAVERRENDEYYTVMRRKNEANSKRVPWYFFLVILFFMYDDVPSPVENGILFRLVASVLILAAIPFAFGQGHIVWEMLNLISEKFGASGMAFGKTKKKE
jgi:hypothetical protein